MKYIMGSLIISFGILFILTILLIATGIQMPKSVTEYAIWAWPVLAIIIYPFSRKIIR